MQHASSINQPYDPYAEEIRNYENALEMAPAPEALERMEGNLDLLKHNYYLIHKPNDIYKVPCTSKLVLHLHLALL